MSFNGGHQDALQPAGAGLWARSTSLKEATHAAGPAPPHATLQRHLSGGHAAPYLSAGLRQPHPGRPTSVAAMALRHSVDSAPFLASGGGVAGSGGSLSLGMQLRLSAMAGGPQAPAAAQPQHAQSTHNTPRGASKGLPDPQPSPTPPSAAGQWSAGPAAPAPLRGSSPSAGSMAASPYLRGSVGPGSGSSASGTREHPHHPPAASPAAAAARGPGAAAGSGRAWAEGAGRHPLPDGASPRGAPSPSAGAPHPHTSVATLPAASPHHHTTSSKPDAGATKAGRLLTAYGISSPGGGARATGASADTKGRAAAAARSSGSTWQDLAPGGPPAALAASFTAGGSATQRGAPRALIGGGGNGGGDVAPPRPGSVMASLARDRGGGVHKPTSPASGAHRPRPPALQHQGHAAAAVWGGGARLTGESSQAIASKLRGSAPAGDAAWRGPRGLGVTAAAARRAQPAAAARALHRHHGGGGGSSSSDSGDSIQERLATLQQRGGGAREGAGHAGDEEEVEEEDGLFPGAPAVQAEVSIPLIVTAGDVVVGTLGLTPQPPPARGHSAARLSNASGVVARASGGLQQGAAGESLLQGHERAAGGRARVSGGLSGSGAPQGLGMPVSGDSLVASMSYEDIPVEDHVPFENDDDGEESHYGGMTLDMFMRQMYTTPASQAATSGLGELDEDHATPVAPHAHTARPPHAALAPPPPPLHAPHPPPAAHAFLGGTGSGSADAALPSSGAVSGLAQHGPAAVAASLNNLDLRPATAAVVPRPRGGDLLSPAGPGSLLGGGAAGASAADGFAQHHHLHVVAPVRQVDLGGLSPSLFTPSAAQQQAAAEAAAGGGGSNGAGGPHSPSRKGAWSGAAAAGGGGSSMRGGNGAAAPPWGVEPGGGARLGGGTAAGSGAGAAALLSDRASGGAAAHHAARGSDPAGLPQQYTATVHLGAGLLRPDGGLEADEVTVAAAAAAALVRPQGPSPGGARQVQSARPGSRGDEIDPSVWRERIAVQLQRPPSRQRPPPEALHLWAPLGKDMPLAVPAHAPSGPRTDTAGGPPRGGGAGGVRMMRPHSAAPVGGGLAAAAGGAKPLGTALGLGAGAGGGGGGAAAFAAPGAKLLVSGSMQRPPSRQKPPPMSVLAEMAESEFGSGGGAGESGDSPPGGGGGGSILHSVMAARAGGGGGTGSGSSAAAAAGAIKAAW